MSELDERIRSLLAAGDIGQATTIALRQIGPEILGFLTGVLNNSNEQADEVFSTFMERLWRSLNGFEGRCSLRTWMYVLARRELGRYRRGEQRHANGRVPISQLQEILEEVRKTRTTIGVERRNELTKLRDGLPVEDRTLLILRVDRNMPWEDIALAFAEHPEETSEAEQKREAARLRKRFQLVKKKLMSQLRPEV
ncbi:MAG TPA: sigma-70 family RNA polymerase sigma factor [Kofleriaceae bacterium]|nr:sigma-70 family RNA polymerase sigma factor [Kofleriaceae bacterium]